jgi:purine-nucleoside phosphorylase
LAAGLSDETLSHAHTLVQAQAASEHAGALLADIVQALPHGGPTGADATR